MNANGVGTREFLLGDYERAVALWNAVEGVEICEGDSRAEIAQYLQRNPGLSRIAEVDGEIAGAALCGHDGRRGFIYHLAVANAFRGRGVGRVLLEDCLRGLRAAGIPRAIILVADDNSLGQEFWRRNRWEQIEAYALTRDLLDD
ncbi:MAG: GNAT family N-acetyltransferase [Chthoniobacterales bacterium]